jgi:Fe-S-cluster containining protein
MSKNNINNSNPQGEPMECRRCGVCCTRHQAYVRQAEMQRIIAFLGITEMEWSKQYEDPRWEYNDYRLIIHINGACAFLRYENGLAACSIYPVRPACCSDWQPGAEKRECRQGISV